MTQILTRVFSTRVSHDSRHPVFGQNKLNVETFNTNVSLYLTALLTKLPPGGFILILLMKYSVLGKNAGKMTFVT